MNWEQAVQFNKNYNGTLGWCLDYVQMGYGIGGGASTGGVSAWDSWSRICKKKHANYLFPKNVVIPVWFSGTWNGNYYGHVAVLNTATGEVYTSPYFKQRGHEVYASLDALIATFRGAMPDIQFVGWSEDIAGVQVIKEVESMAIIQNTDGWFGELWDLYKRYTGKDISRQIFNSYVGKDFYEFVLDVKRIPESKKGMEWQALGKKAEKEGWSKPGEAEKKLESIKKAGGW
ncbi:hypothetical protein GS464_20070 [Rhodococcus hoagii]|nr:hypothetical protein [Prescottella equi]